VGWVGLGPGTRVLGTSDIQKISDGKEAIGIGTRCRAERKGGKRTTTVLLDDLRPLSGGDLGGHFGCCCCCFVVKTKGVVVVVEECWRVD